MPKKPDTLEIAASELVMKMPGIMDLWGLFRKEITDDPETVVSVSVRGSSRPLFRYNPERVAEAGRMNAMRIVYMECLRLALGHLDTRAKEPFTPYKKASDTVVATFAMKKFPFDPSLDTGRASVSQFPTWEHYAGILLPAGISFPDRFSLENVFEVFKDELNEDGELPDEDEDKEDNSETGNESDEDEDDGTDGENCGKSAGGADGGTGDTGAGEADGNPGVADEHGDSVEGEEGEQDPDGDSGDSLDGDSRDGEGEDSPDADGAASSAMSDYFSQMPDQSEWEGSDEVDSDVASAVRSMSKSGLLKELGNAVVTSIRDTSGMAVPSLVRALRRFTCSVMSEEREDTWLRPNRRYGTSVPGSRAVYRPKLLLAVDISGSMEINVAKCAGHIRDVARALDLDICFWNTSCTNPVHMNSGWDARSVPRAWGGTDPSCIMENMSVIRNRYDGYVVVTDCEFEWERPREWRKVFILSVSNRDRPPEWCRYTFVDEKLNN